MAKSKQIKKERAPKYTLEPFTIEEWNKIIIDHLCAGSKPLCIETEWLETKNGTLWPHKVVRDEPQRSNPRKRRADRIAA